jgi:peptide/nickel transport system permease protein
VLSYALQRCLLGIVTIAMAMTILFALIYAIPGDPASIALGPRATPAMKEELRERMGLDQPLAYQLFFFIRNAATGDLGVDVWTGRSVLDTVREVLPNTLVLIGASLGWAAAIGIPLGCYSAIRRGSWFDHVAGVLSIGTITMPSFIVALYSLLIFAVALRWLPAIGAGEPGDRLDQALHLLLPALAVGLGWVGYLARLVRASMVEVLGEKHIQTAVAYGLPPALIMFRHALPLAILPTLTLLGIAAGRLLSAAVFAELVFNRPGVGLLVYNSALTRNYPVVMGCVLVTVTLFVLFALIADLVVALVDPRVRATL